MMKAADSDVITYRTSTKGGEIFLDIKQDLCGQEYLKITQSKHQGNKDFHRETIFINKDEILQFKQELDKAIFERNDGAIRSRLQKLGVKLK